MPLGAQLAGRIRTAVQKAPSCGASACQASGARRHRGREREHGRAVYARLESEGIVRSEQGRGTFVTARNPADGAATRQQLHRKSLSWRRRSYACLHPARPEDLHAARSRGAPHCSQPRISRRCATSVVRLHELDEQRARFQRSRSSEHEDETSEAGEITPSRRGSPSLAGAQIRWVGA